MTARWRKGLGIVFAFGLAGAFILPFFTNDATGLKSLVDGADGPFLIIYLFVVATPLRFVTRVNPRATLYKGTFATFGEKAELWITLSFFAGMMLEYRTAINAHAQFQTAITTRQIITRALPAASVALLMIFFIAVGARSILAVVHVVSHPCVCVKCRRVRRTYTIMMSIFAVAHFGVGAWMARSRYRDLQVSGAVLQTAGAVYATGALACVVYIFGNKRRHKFNTYCARVPAAALSAGDGASVGVSAPQPPRIHK